MGKIDPKNELRPETRAWGMYMRQAERARRWFWVLCAYGIAGVGYFIYSCIRQDWMPVWASALQIIVNLLLVIGQLMSNLKLARLLSAWSDLHAKLEMEAMRALGRREGIREFQDAMIKEMRAQRQAREEAAQADAARDGHAAHRYVQAQRLEIEGP